MSGSETISSSGVPARLRSIPVSPFKTFVQRLAGILFQVRASDADRLASSILEQECRARRLRPLAARTG